MDKPNIKKNEIYDIQIDAQGSEGEGIGRIDGFTVFVKNAVEGDVVNAKILKVNKSFAFAKIEKIITPSPYRSEPKCSVYNRCGGCNFMHISYEKQLRLKNKRIFDALTRIGGCKDINLPDLIGMTEPYYYRNKTQLPVGTDKSGNVITGFFAPRTHSICAFDECICAPKIQKTVTDTIKSFMKKYNISAYDEENHKGIVRHIFVRTSKRGEVMVVIITNALDLPYSDKLVDMLKENVASLVSVVQNINMDKTNLILGKNNITLYGSDTLVDSIGDLTFNISPLSFYQINAIQTQKLYNTALEFASLTGNETVFDLYSGIGTISLFMAKHAKKVLGFEIVPDAVEDAKKNAKLNNIENAHFYCGPVEKTVVETYNAGERADVIMLDPPRKGADEITLETIIKTAPKRIVYVSCNPETLARDVKFLRENGGYEIKKVQGVDMFPHTAHVETVTLLKKS